MAVCGLLLESNAATAKLARLIDPDNSNNKEGEGRSSRSKQHCCLAFLRLQSSDDALHVEFTHQRILQPATGRGQ